MSDTRQLYDRATDSVSRRVEKITDWSAPTPCTEWDVRALVNHLISECAWLAAMLRGETMEQIGDRFSGDLVGEDGMKSWHAAARDAADAVATTPPDTKVTLSSGPATADRYAQEIASDLAVHSWDLARAVGDDDSLDGELVELAVDVFGPMVEEGRKGGYFGEPPEVPADADAQTKMLALFGRKR